MRPELILIVLVSLFSCASRTKITKPFFYKVTKGEQTIHILGTAHVGMLLEDFPAAVKNEITRSELVALEADEGTRESAKILAKMEADKLFERWKEPYPNLVAKLKPKTWEHLKYTLSIGEVQTYVQGLGIDHSLSELHPTAILVIFEHFRKENAEYYFHPDVINSYSVYSIKSIEEQASLELDLEIQKLAEDSKISVLGLDDARQATKAIMQDPEDYILGMIEGIFGNGSRKSHESLQELQKAYRSGDEGAILKYADDSEINKEQLLYDRNRYWFDQLNHKDEKNIFVAVGALHLVGEQSLLSFLADRGYKVQRLENLK